MKSCIVKDRFDYQPIAFWAFAGMKWDYLKMVIHFKKKKEEGGGLPRWEHALLYKMVAHEHSLCREKKQQTALLEP